MDFIDDEPGNSKATDGKAKRKRRTKEEIEQEKMEKKLKRIQRESAKKSKLEQFLYCYVDRSICLLDDSIKQELTNRFTERKIADQLAFVDGDFGMGKIIWKRKRVDAVIEDGKVKSLETMDPEGCFIHVIEGAAFNQLIKSDGLQSFVDDIATRHCHSSSMPNIVVFGQGGPHTTQTTTLSLKSFEHYRNQVRYCKTAADFSFLVANFHRIITKSSDRLAQFVENNKRDNEEKTVNDFSEESVFVEAEDGLLDDSIEVSHSEEFEHRIIEKETEQKEDAQVPKLQIDENVKQNREKPIKNAPSYTRKRVFTEDNVVRIKPKRKRNIRSYLNPLNDSDDDFVDDLMFTAAEEDLEIRPTWEDSSSEFSLTQVGWNMVNNRAPRVLQRSIEVADELEDDEESILPLEKSSSVFGGLCLII